MDSAEFEGFPRSGGSGPSEGSGPHPGHPGPPGDTSDPVRVDTSDLFPDGAADPFPEDGPDPFPEAGGPPGGRLSLRATAETGLKIVVVGGFGVGKTTLVRSVSEIRPLNTEETLTRTGEGIDDLTGVEAKSATTVAFDFGRITLGPRHVLYLFGAPGQARFWFLWDQLFAGALGAVVLVDTRRIDDCWYAIDRLEQLGTPFIVARNDFGGHPYSPAELRAALDLAPDIPVIDCDARSRESSARVLITLVEHLTRRYDAGVPPPGPGADAGTLVGPAGATGAADPRDSNA